MPDTSSVTTPDSSSTAKAVTTSPVKKKVLTNAQKWGLVILGTLAIWAVIVKLEKK